MRGYDNETGNMDTIKYQKDPIIWYKDSLIIEETFLVQFYMNDTTYETTWAHFPWEFTFIDLPNRGFYVFSSFSDTATLIRKYTQPDSIKGSIVNFWGDMSPWDANRSALKPANDSIIAGVNYKRFKEIDYRRDTIKNKLVTRYFISYLDCNGKVPPLFSQTKWLSDRVGCPVKRWDMIVPNEFHLVNDILYLADTLTAKEQKVFKAWAKYAKEHPVEK